MENHEPNDGLNAPALVTAGVVAAAGTFILIVGLQVLYLHYQSRASATKEGILQTSAASLIAEQRSKLNRYGWLNREEGVVTIPIDLAIRITAEKLGRASAGEPQVEPESSNRQIDADSQNPGAAADGEAGSP